VAFIGFGHISGVTLALAVGGSVFLNQATNGIAKILPSISRKTVQKAITGLGGDLFFTTISSEKREAVLRTIAKSIGNVYGIVLFAGAMSIVLSLLMKRERLVFDASKKEGQDHLEAAKEDESGSIKD